MNSHTTIGVTITDREQDLPPLRMDIDMMPHLPATLQTAIYVACEYRRLMDQMQHEHHHDDEAQG